MDVDDASGHLHGAGESNLHIADTHRHRISIDDDETALRVHDEAGSVIVALGNSRHGIRHVERDHDERRRQRREA